MSLFQCEQCGCCENTALSNYSWRKYKGMPTICSACDTDESIGAKGKWHDMFERVFLPKGKFKTNDRGNLEHIATGREDFRAYALTEQEKTP